jgi:hypothetical protein
VVPTLLDEVLVQLCVLSPDSVCSSEVKLLPAEIQLLVDQFLVLFQEPDGLPPSRACEHEIPLIPGA